MAFRWGTPGLQEQPIKVKQRQHGHNNSCDKFCNNKTKKNFTRHRTRTIANSVAVRQCTGHSTTGPIRLPKKASRNSFQVSCFDITAWNSVCLLYTSDAADER